VSVQIAEIYDIRAAAEGAEGRDAGRDLGVNRNERESQEKE
jgi:hypothetical protein